MVQTTEDSDRYHNEQFERAKNCAFLHLLED